jgi:phage terminase large subunit-like protein
MRQGAPTTATHAGDHLAARGGDAEVERGGDVTRGVLDDADARVRVLAREALDLAARPVR